MTTADDELTVDDEIVARARIHTRDVLDGCDLEIDRDALEWTVTTRPRRRAGACRWDADREVATIVLTRQAYERYEWEAFAGVVRHELVHVWEFQRFGESSHGPRFREQATRLEAPRHCETFAEPRYVLRCLAADCDWEAHRHRASKPVKAPGTYRCGTCGNTYEVEHVDSGRTWTTASGFGGAKAALGDRW
ncbi:SprT-like domain-containing protein [Natronolimnohabitans sp. A-GB9]|uniref:SprT family zinc-dependent metalloprotease n=1 Tax=Natronolimnohabitans sp. A-GB9 TaxID=3069757 RepID=UPI0027B1121F|nr:SprT-like domain-containing protein [Natronolimnohabitans sp. A-GB9]MDQ2049889.1 SprT-like domain-containing protein [Natronolimnohabitans sp. A-GB9]